MLTWDWLAANIFSWEIDLGYFYVLVERSINWASCQLLFKFIFIMVQSIAICWSYSGNYCVENFSRWHKEWYFLNFTQGLRHFFFVRTKFGKVPLVFLKLKAWFQIVWSNLFVNIWNWVFMLFCCYFIYWYVLDQK